MDEDIVVAFCDGKIRTWNKHDERSEGCSKQKKSSFEKNQFLKKSIFKHSQRVENIDTLKLRKNMNP